MSDSVREEALDWWKEALYNLKQAKKIFEIKEFSISSFLSHQAAEKVINWIKNKANLSEST